MHTFWKSDPYLTSAFTGDADALHPQWVVVDLGAPSDVNAIKIRWADPYATQYRIEYWQGDDPMGDPSGGAWSVLPNGSVERGRGGDVHAASWQGDDPSAVSAPPHDRLLEHVRHSRLD